MREQGNGQGAAAGGGGGRKQSKASRATEEDVRQLRPEEEERRRAGRRFQSSGCGEEGMERRMGRQEAALRNSSCREEGMERMMGRQDGALRNLANYPGARREEGREELGGPGRRRGFGSNIGMIKTTGSPFRSPSSPSLLLRVTTLADSPQRAAPRLQ